MFKNLLRSDLNVINLNSILGFMSGLPLLLTSSTLQAWFVDYGIDLVTIGALSLIGIPYTLKFLWAPLLDTFHFASDAPRRYWILMSQCLIFWLMLLLSFMTPKYMPKEMAAIAFIITIFSATQDVAIDAYRQVFTPVKLRTIVVSCSTTTYRLAMIITGGIALIMADYLGWSFTYKVMSAQVFVGFFLTWSIAKPYEDFKEKKDYEQMLLTPLKKLASVKNFKSLIAIIILYKISDAFLLNFIQPFLMQGMGYSKSYVGTLVKVFGLIATIVGAFSASLYAEKVSFYKSLLMFGYMQIVALLLFMLLANFKSHNLAVCAVFIESLCNGATSCLLISLFMNICNDNDYAATQISFLSAIASLPRVALGPVAGVIAQKCGWVEFFAISTGVAIPGVLLLQYYKSNIISHFCFDKNENLLSA